MSTKNFFEKQSDGTAVKIKFYENYIEGYNIKVLMQYGMCLIADLFCGPGKNGNEFGSPLILIEKSKKILENPILLKKYNFPEIFIIFNDNSKENIIRLNSELSNINIPKNITIIEPQNNSFSNILQEIIKIDNSMPKFFFLDPFTYSDVQLDEIRQLMNLKLSEIMFFVPTFHAYRFKTAKNIPKKLIDFLNNFTEKGVYDYKNFYEFTNSIIYKLRNELKLKFVQHALINDGCTKKSLFLLTKSPKAAMLFNNIFWKETYDGKTLNVSTIKEYEKMPCLFSKSVLPTLEYKKSIADFCNKLVEELINKKEMFNTEIIEFAIMEGCKPKYANEILLNLKKKRKIEAKYQHTSKNRGFYVSENNYNKKLCKIVYL